MSRHLARETAFKILFEFDMTGKNVEEIFSQHMEQEEVLKGFDQKFTLELINGVVDNIAAIDEQLVPYLKKWHLKRLPVTDRSILRVALFELLYRPDIPPNVSINEAVELAKAYSDNKGAKFINGVLDRVSKSLKEG